MHYLNDLTFQLFWHLPMNVMVLAQQVSDPNLMGQVQKAWNHFIQTGQVWALLIGVVIGWLFRNLTSYG
ncbi:hypothetical protein BCD64_02695 [Nostoc sp. MBR 210]|uniref:Uncharacterized protein n=1 Tax=Nostoc spongiaeforme FACHB-130 TaxID=1357510 RepID=A0ABR8FZJ2_9NOSO|nr:hypothetical protein [Nostoc spongiaeforme]MBD2596140.1 hypothetical protein [Nostoc spongiaeforme FACHB-130]OCR00019.1 hypothetical protein BCD64_02695 [Nostoc sp. MBR 210]